MKDYEQVLLWCKTFLFENSFSPYKGNDVAFALLFDMNLLFESYVGHYLKMNHNDVQLQDKTHHLACLNGSGKFQLKPDIVIDNGRIVADTKWKLLDEDKTHQGVSQADMYQLFAYGKKYTKSPCKKLFLVYPKQVDNESLLEHTYHFENPAENPKECGNKLDLQILFFDLSKDLKDLNSPPIEQFWKERTTEDIK
jgi:5-methylcytosine-specific restriction enzyme subunit McrC